MLSMEQWLALIGVLACLALVAGGCGSSSDSTSSTAADGAAGNGTGTDSMGADKGGSSGSGSGAGAGNSKGSTTAKGSGSSGSGSGSGGSSSGLGGSSSRGGGKSGGSGGPGTNDNGAPLGTDTSNSGDNSIQSYGTDAQGPEKAAAVSAWRSFVMAIAARDSATVCAGLSSRLRAGLSESNKMCPELLSELVTIPPAEARNSASGNVTHVRTGGGNAFVLFYPADSNELNYFVLTLEDGQWKSLGLTVGDPLSPSVPGE